MKISTTRDRTQGKITLPSVWRGTVLRIAAVLFWILLWAVAAHKVGLPVLLPSPLSVAQRLVQLCVTADFLDDRFCLAGAHFTGIFSAEFYLERCLP